MNNNVTYLLGAGASYNCLPLVSDMTARLEIFLKFLDLTFSNRIGFVKDEFSEEEIKFIQDKIIMYKLIFEQIKKHYTPDTYAKKLTLTKKKDDLSLFKELLNLYFIFEQDNLDIADEFNLSDMLSLKKPSFNDLYTEEQKINLNLFNKINNKIDYRYDVFFSSYLIFNEKTEELVLPDNVRILSWNYDNQLEFAFNEISKNDDLRKVKSALKISNYSEFNSIGFPSILKLNGQSNYFNLLNGFKINLKDELKSLLNTKQYLNTISFAWENSYNSELLIRLSKISNFTDILIIIGYSFPNFNKEIDAIIINNAIYGINKSLKIFIQVPEVSEYEKIKLRINMKLEYPLADNQFFHIKDVDQFFIP
jgi:hypothetical protein